WTQCATRLMWYVMESQLLGGATTAVSPVTTRIRPAHAMIRDSDHAREIGRSAARIRLRIGQSATPCTMTASAHLAATPSQPRLWGEPRPSASAKSRTPLITHSVRTAERGDS